VCSPYVGTDEGKRCAVVTGDLEEGRSLDLGYYGAVLRRRWRVVLAGLLIGIVGGVAYLSLAQKMVTATATVNLNVISTASLDLQKPPSQLLDPETETQIATSATVLDDAASVLGTGQTLGQMRSATTVTPVAGATVVKISYSAATRRQAVAGANAIAGAYLDYRSTAAATKISNVVSKLSLQRNTLKAKLKHDNSKLNNADTSSSLTPAEVQAETDRQLVNIELSSVVSQINELKGVDTSGGSPLTSAADNPVKHTPTKQLALSAGVLLGLIVGIVLAFVTNAFDRRVADGRTLSALGGGEILSELRSRRAFVPAEGADLDQVRSLRERLLASTGPGGNVVVMDLVIRDRPSDIAVNLALSMVERGGPVRLVLPDHGKDDVRLLVRALDLRSADKSSEVVTYTSSWAPGLEVVVTQENYELGVPGARLGNILSSTHRPDLTTVVAMPPKATRSLWLTAGRLGHSIILVTARRETRVSAVRQRVDELEAVGAVIHGSVLLPRRRSVEVKPAKRRPVKRVTAVADEEVPRAGTGSEVIDDLPTETTEERRDVDTPLDFDENPSDDGKAERRGVSSGRP
jgi:capsular polysaccharide biosynthesis protein